MTSAINKVDRSELLDQFETQDFDVLIIGGGITGAGILREASKAGLRALLLEADDFASGTSSKSTKLIHGGLRYLAMGHIHVVREAARERKRVNQLAPHLAEPKWLMVPAANRFELLKYQIGITAYEYLGQVDKADRHRSLSGASLRDYEPTLNTQRFPYAVIYREYLTDDARLVLANIRAGLQAGSYALNQAKVDQLLYSDDQVVGASAVCGVTQRRFEVNAKVVINAAGPWVEQVCKLDSSDASPQMILSRGVHVVVRHSLLPVTEPIFMVGDDGRPVFVVPKGDVVYIGTTDDLHEGGAEFWPEVTKQDIDYLVKTVDVHFDVKIEAQDCLTTWAGLRPLISESGKSTREVSRKDEVWQSKAGLVTIAGGKLTGYRKMAEDTLSVVSNKLALPVPDSEPEVPLPGGNFSVSLTELSEDIAQRWQLSEPIAYRLVRLYGSETNDVLDLGHNPIVTNGKILTGEIHWGVQHEFALSLEDVLYRRTRAAVYEPKETHKLLEPVSQLLKEYFGWTEDDRQAQIQHLIERLEQDGNLPL
ncbi:MAG: glycerol-3-phosphate dehydrogenase/oxidase [Pseudomonadales bacterium]